MITQRPDHACTGKVRFLTIDDAKRAISGSKKHSKRRRLGSSFSGGSIHPYRCPKCRNWHIGHGLRKPK